MLWRLFRLFKGNDVDRHVVDEKVGQALSGCLFKGLDLFLVDLRKRFFYLWSTPCMPRSEEFKGIPVVEIARLRIP